MLKALFAAIVVMGLAMASPASAHQSRHVRLTQEQNFQVDFRDLNLGDRDARSELMSRIVQASQMICGQDQDEMTRSELKRCIRVSVANALANAPAPVQMALRDEPMIELAQR